MTRVLIIGASKGIGLETTRQALDAGHKARALARSAPAIALSDPNLEKARGDALKAKDVEAALKGIDVVIQALGVGFGDLFRPVRLFSDATRVLIPAMKARGRLDMFWLSTWRSWEPYTRRMPVRTMCVPQISKATAESKSSRVSIKRPPVGHPNRVRIKSAACSERSDVMEEF